MSYQILFNENNLPVGFIASAVGDYSEQEAKDAILCGKINPTNEEISAYTLANISYITANVYKVQRALAYPSIQDQLDTLYHGGLDAWKASITAVKEGIPK